MSTYINLMAVQVNKKMIKFDTLLVYNYYLIVKNTTQYLDTEKIIKKMILKSFKKFYKNNNISEIEDLKQIEELMNRFQKNIRTNNDILNNMNKLYDLFIMVQHYNPKLKTINVHKDEFIEEMINTYFFKLLEIRKLFYV